MSWTMALGLIVENKKQVYHYMFAGLMFCLGSLQLVNGLWVSGKLGDYSWMIFWYMPFLAMTGPLFFFAFKSANNDSFRFRPIEYFHFAFSLITVLLLIPLARLDAATKLSFIMQIPSFSNDDIMFRLYSGLISAVILNIVGYMIYFIRECFFMLDIKLIREKKVSPHLITIVLICLPFYIIFYGSIMAIIIIENPLPFFFDLIRFLTALSFLLTLVIFIMEKKNIRFFKVLHTQLENRRYEISMTQNLDVSHVISRLRSLLDEEKIFCDEDISVGSLARELAIEPYQLSRIINENFNKNFKNFINEYRIEEAKKILLSEPDRTITSVAYAVGFNSTTVFYEWFSRIAGIPPKKFRHENRDLADVTTGAVISD